MQLDGSIVRLPGFRLSLAHELLHRSSAVQFKSGVLREVALAGRGLSHQLAQFRLEGLLVRSDCRQGAARGMSTTGVRCSRLSQTATASAHAL